MHIFIDESGNFSAFRPMSLSAVGALAIPDSQIDAISSQYAQLRSRLPVQNGELKGRSLNEAQVNDVVEMLVAYDVLFEISFVDLGMLTESAVSAYKKAHGDYTLGSVDRFHEPARGDVESAGRQILATSLPLYIQAVTTFELMHRLIGHTTLYYVQRLPAELGAFSWIVDGKQPGKITRWETWWSGYAQGALATMSKKRPSPMLEGADYSYYDRFAAVQDGGEKGTDLKLLLKDIRFSPRAEPGLELVDILVNATRRALVGNLQQNGWENIPRLMVHRTEPYIQFILLGEGEDTVRR
jgi:hypothetical protein